MVPTLLLEVQASLTQIYDIILIGNLSILIELSTNIYVSISRCDHANVIGIEYALFVYLILVSTNNSCCPDCSACLINFVPF